jgi:hypothetical protein
MDALMHRLRSVIDELLALDDNDLVDADAVVDLARQLSRLDAAAARQAAAFERHGRWADAGAQNASAWITTACRMDRSRARQRVRAGRTMRMLDRVDQSFATGRITGEHVLVLARARDRSRLAARGMARDEAQLIAWAESLPFHQFKRRVDEWLLIADEDAVEREAGRLHQGRRVHLSQSYEDQWFLDGVLDPINGEIVAQTLRAITDVLFEADWAAATRLLGERPTATQLVELTRSPAQRRADALVEMATRARMAPADGRRPQPLFTVLVGEASFSRTVELGSGRSTTPGSLARWIDDALIERIVFDGPDRVLGVGMPRAFRGALRRAAQVLGRTCSSVYCDAPASVCEVDHIVPDALGGATSLANARLFCAFDHRRHHRENHPGFRTGPNRPAQRPGERAA